MRYKLVISFLLLLAGILSLPREAEATLQCLGDGLASVISSECVLNLATGLYRCETDEAEFNASCLFDPSCIRAGMGSKDDTGCKISYDQRSCEVMAGGIIVTTFEGCYTCDDAVCQSGTTSCQSQGCGEVTVDCSCTNMCGGTNTWTEDRPCEECEDCLLACGQEKDCNNEFCSSASAGVPTTPACTNLGLVSAMPVTISWTGGGVLADDYQYSVDGGAAVTTVNTSASVSLACGAHTWKALARNTTCSGYGGISSTPYSSTCSVCYHCAPTLGAWSAWSACDASHQRTRTRTCVDNDGTCDGDDCAGLTVETQDCVGTIQGTLFDASDLPTCPGDIGSNPVYSLLRIGGQPFDMTGTWGPISASTNASGNYSVSTFVPATYNYDYSSLIASGRVSGVKLECQGAAASLSTIGETVTKDTGFWRQYGGWWQVTGGSVYAGGGVGSNVPSSVSPVANQKLILADVNSRSGMLSYGVPWVGDELGTNPNAVVSAPGWRIQSLYGGLRYDYDFFETKMRSYDYTPWEGDEAKLIYDDGGKGYQIFKVTDSALSAGITLKNYGGPTGAQKVILLVDGDVRINGNLDVPNGAFLAVIASGDITFGSAVTRAEGWFVGENISVACKDLLWPMGCDKTDSQFVGEGSFVAWSGMSLVRDMGTGNNAAPAESFVYRPDMMVNAPEPMGVYGRKYSPFIP